MSLRATVKLMRQQTSVSCQCHPEGDVSTHGYLSLRLLLIIHSPVLTAPAHSLFYDPTLHDVIPFFLPSILSLSTSFYLLCLFHGVALLSPPDLNSSIFFSSTLSILPGDGVSLKGAVLVLPGCYREQSEGEGRPVGDGVLDILNTDVYFKSEFRVLFSAFLVCFFVWLSLGETPAESWQTEALEDNSSACILLTRAHLLCFGPGWGSLKGWRHVCGVLSSSGGHVSE